MKRCPAPVEGTEPLKDGKVFLGEALRTVKLARGDWAQLDCTAVVGGVVRGGEVGSRLRSGLLVAGLAGAFRVFRMRVGVRRWRWDRLEGSVGGCLGCLKD